MIKELKEPYRSRIQELVDALRSGIYKQGIGYLRRDDTYCCLGVACDLINPNEWTEPSPEDYYKNEHLNSEYVIGVFRYHDQNTIMPEDVQVYYGFDDSRGIFFDDEEGYATSLTEQNDAGFDFDHIADLIENNARTLVHDYCLEENDNATT